ncbi:hypothetical protein F4780DRAFT_280872 [Xylariomycetidae sp. FL0641]|nr:hypothetical protein F4780DRAFT_280872 [Xylariomycetidae sp. FL0641]
MPKVPTYLDSLQRANLSEKWNSIVVIWAVVTLQTSSTQVHLPSELAADISNSIIRTPIPPSGTESRLPEERFHRWTGRDTEVAPSSLPLRLSLHVPRLFASTATDGSSLSTRCHFVAMNRTRASDPDDAHLRRCWRIQDCRSCLEQTDCSWCPFVRISRSFSVSTTLHH